jgi:uncharacterized membrane protein YkvA (DUF1232 family)
VKDILLATLILIGVALLILIVAGGFIAWKVLRSDERALMRRIGKLRFRDKLAFGRRLMRDPRVPWRAKIIAGAVVAYVASPIDLIPDFIPVLGYVDDLLVAIIGGVLLLRSVPRHVVEEHLQAYEARAEQKGKDCAPAV